MFKKFALVIVSSMFFLPEGHATEDTENIEPPPIVFDMMPPSKDKTSRQPCYPRCPPPYN